MYKMGPDEILCRYVLLHKQERVLAKACGGIAIGHYGWHGDARNILRARLCWEIVHGTLTDYARSFDVCQITRKPLHKDEIPLVPQVMLQPFDKWEVDFVGPINLPEKRTGA